MKTVYFDDLKTLTTKHPLYCVLSKTPQKNGDPRAIGCATLALLNLLILIKKRMGVEQDQTAYELLFNEILPRIDEQDDLSVEPESVFALIDTHPIFNGWKNLVLNPSAMTPEVFWQIALRRLLNGDIGFCMLEIPENKGEEATKKLNHLSVIHSDGTNVFYDGLKMTADALTNILFFSPVNTVMFFSKPAQGGGL